MPLHEHLVGVEVTFPGAGNQVGVSHLGPGLHLCPVIGSCPVMPCRVQPPARIRHASDTRAGGFTAACEQKAAQFAPEVCDDPAGEASSVLTARDGAVDAA
jgi:hypothetical protein